MIAVLSLLLASLAAAGGGDAAPTAAAAACLPLPGVGCWYAPKIVTGDPPVLVYLRGHHPTHRAAVPPGEALASARQAFEFYQLGRIADSTGHLLIVTYKSGLAVSNKDIAKVAAESGFTISSRTVAAHSGAYVGLEATLANGMPFDRLVLLDSFYSGSPALAKAVQARFPSGPCVGFYTPHSFKRSNGTVYDNERNFLANFKPHAPGCRIEKRGGNEHNEGVKLCLASYLTGAVCR